MRRPILLLLTALALLPAGCGRNENAQGTPDGEVPSTQERQQAPSPTTTQEP